jgi:hypothetical protein
MTRAGGIALLDQIVNLHVLIVRPVGVNARNQQQKQNSDTEKPFHDNAW